MLDLVALDYAVPGNDGFQLFSEFWNVPLSVTEGVQMPALGNFRTDLKCRIERSRRDYPQIFIQYKNRFADCIDDGLGKGTGVLGVGKLIPEGDRIHELSQYWYAD